VCPGQEIDLDLQCVILNELGQIEDAVYYNQLSSKISRISLSLFSLSLSGDSLGERSGYDEYLSIDLLSYPF